MRTCLLLLLTVCASAETLMHEGFQGKLGPRWPQLPAAWRVVDEPGNVGNRVLQFSGQTGSGLTFGDGDWENVELSVRVRVEQAPPGWLHIKLGARTAPDNALYLNLRDTGPAIIRQQAGQFTPVAQFGNFPLRTGCWYRATVRYSGPVVSASVQSEADPRELASARVLAEGLSSGPLRLDVAFADGSATVLFDDLRVEAVAAATTEGGRTVTAERDGLRVSLDSFTGALTFTDLRSGNVWGQTVRTGILPQIEDPTAEPQALRYTLNLSGGRARVDVELQPGAEALVTLTPMDRGPTGSVSYPPPLLPPSRDCEWVLPADEGVLIRADRQDMPGLAATWSWAQGSLIMPWYGLLRGDAGLMVMVETAVDWSMQTARATGSGAPVVTAVSNWLPSRGALSYPRRIRFCVFDRGGYVAMAKRYRRYVQETGRLKTAAERARSIPAVAKLVGAIDIYDQTPGDDPTVLDWMIQSGIHHALYYGGPSVERNRKAREAGYVTSIYDIYTDIAGPELLAIWGPPRDALDYRRIGYPDECVLNADGKPRRGFAYPVGARGGVDGAGAAGQRIPCYNRCNACKLAWLQKVIPPQLERVGYMARFLDVETAVAPWECYSDRHPLTRSEDMQARRGLFEYLRSLGQVTASEGGADWASDLLDYQEGSLTLNHFGGIPGVYVGTRPFSLPDPYIRVQFDPTIRVPLRELVYHDCSWVTWRWNHTPNRWDKREWWDDWDLIHLISAQMPIFILNARDWEGSQERVLQTYRNVCGFLDNVGGVEMIDHCFLTPDRTVQESRFANGWSVIVNFSHDRSFTTADGQVIAPRGFLTTETRP